MSMMSTSVLVQNHRHGNKERKRSVKKFHLQCFLAFAVIVYLALFFGQLSSTTTSSFINVNVLFHQRAPTKVYPSDPKLPSFAFARFTHKGQGFFNQQMAFSGAIMMLVDHMAKQKQTQKQQMQTQTQTEDHYQIVLPSLVFLDYMGTDEDILFDRLFDVDHWNSYVPRLPRIVSFDKKQHYQYDTNRHAAVPNKRRYHHPFFMSSADVAFQIYHDGYLRLLETGNKTDMHPTDQLILQGALRPAPAVQAAIDRVVQDGNFAAFHLRFEQDYLCQPWGLTVRNLTQTLAHIEKSFGPYPPFDRVFFAINRPVLEDASKMPRKPSPSAKVCKAERRDNLAALNHAVQHGMWGGRVKVFERPPLEEQFRDRPVIFGSLIDSEICRRAKVFVGRFSSTYTKNIIRRRSAVGFNETFDYETGFRKMNGMIFPKVVDDCATKAAAPAESKPLLSFIIPSTLSRDTLNRTIESLQRQTIPHWEAIVGVDVRAANQLNATNAIAEARKTYSDPRVRIVPINTESAYRGEGPTRNGAGAVRNYIMQHAVADWVAFCDDDDTLSPYYIEYWQQGLHEFSEKVDVLIFRMKDQSFNHEWYHGILPPLTHGPVASIISVGISFAIRRSVISRTCIDSQHNPDIVQFESGQSEDFDFLQKVQRDGFRIGQTCCVGYYVRSNPPSDEIRQASCRWDQAFIVEHYFRHTDSLGGGVVPCPNTNITTLSK